MPDTVLSDSPPDPSKRFLDLLRTGLEQNTFVKLVLGKYRGQESGLKRILVRRINIKDEEYLSFVYSYETKDITKNTTIDVGIETVCELLGDPFKSANLFLLTEDVQIEFSRKGKSRLSSSNATCDKMPSGKHNREKNRFLDPGKPFLVALGVTNEKHSVLPSMSRKWKQINKFLEVFHDAFTLSGLSEASDVKVLDFGSGKGYLTFAIHDFLNAALNVQAHTTGVELREDLVSFCNDAVGEIEISNLCFRQGDISSYRPDAIDVMIALHACDTATDQAIYMGISSGAEIIMCAPCCHKQIRPQISIPSVIKPMLKFGVHLGQEAEMVTDSLRALLLEAQGYKAQIFEFISSEHTSKNKMLLAVKHDKAVEKDDILTKIEKIKEFYGIKDHCLETMLNNK
ncbi:MAG: SAM-dependent methyltransferase [Kiritimatiellae bacterium]|nr:SAM-dependent methyltransferase [Kiritimatiellia bacterium]